MHSIVAVAEARFTQIVAWCCKVYKTKASVTIRLVASAALALNSRIPAGFISRMTMTYYAIDMSYPRHTATCHMQQG